MDDGRRHAGDDARRGLGRSMCSLARPGTSRTSPVLHRHRRGAAHGRRDDGRLRPGGSSLRTTGRTGAPAVRTIRRHHGTLPAASAARLRVARRPRTSSSSSRSITSARRPCCEPPASRRRGRHCARPAIAAEARRHRADNLPARGAAHTRGGTPGAPPAATRVAAHGAGHDVADRKAAHDGDVRPAGHRDSGRRSRIDSAMVCGDGSGLDRSAGDVAGRRGNPRHRQGRRTAGWGATSLLFTGVLIGAAYAVKATTIFLVPMAVLACVLDAADTRGRRQRRTCARRAGRALRFAVRPVSLIGLGIALAAGWIHVRAWLVFGDPQAVAFKKAVLEAGGFVPLGGPMPWTAEFWAHMRVMVFEPFWARFGSLGAARSPAAGCGSSTERRRCCRAAGRVRGRELDARRRCATSARHRRDGRTHDAGDRRVRHRRLRRARGVDRRQPGAAGRHGGALDAAPHPAAHGASGATRRRRPRALAPRSRPIRQAVPPSSASRSQRSRSPGSACCAPRC